MPSLCLLNPSLISLNDTNFQRPSLNPNQQWPSFFNPKDSKYTQIPDSYRDNLTQEPQLTHLYNGLTKPTNTSTEKAQQLGRECFPKTEAEDPWSCKRLKVGEGAGASGTGGCLHILTWGVCRKNWGFKRNRSPARCLLCNLSPPGLRTQ